MKTLSFKGPKSSQSKVELQTEKDQGTNKTEKDIY